MIIPNFRDANQRYIHVGHILYNCASSDLSERDPLVSKYDSWQVLKDEDFESLEYLAQLETNVHRQYQMHPSYGINGDPFALDYYPYNGSSVFQSKHSEARFFVYLETGGHGARELCRFFRPELLILPLEVRFKTPHTLQIRFDERELIITGEMTTTPHFFGDIKSISHWTTTDGVVPIGNLERNMLIEQIVKYGGCGVPVTFD